MITHVTRFVNGMVMAFDESGEQVGEYQGRYIDVKKKLESLPDPVEWSVARWNDWEKKISRQEFFML